MTLRNHPSYENINPLEKGMQPLKVNYVDVIPPFPGLETPSLPEKDTTQLNIIGDEIVATLDTMMEAVSPKGLQNLDQNIIEATISHNSYARKHLNSGRVERAHQAIGYLLDRGMPLHIAVGVISNAVAESGLDTTKKPSGLGLFQWIGPRQRKYYQIKDTLPGSNEFEKQLSYMLWELENPEKRAGNLLKTARTPQEASRIFLVHFERPRVKNIDERSAIATGLLQLTDQNSNIA